MWCNGFSVCILHCWDPDPNAKTRADNFKLVYKTEDFVLN